jgi:hypothetical protein
MSGLKVDIATPRQASQCARQVAVVPGAAHRHAGQRRGEHRLGHGLTVFGQDGSEVRHAAQRSLAAIAAKRMQALGRA